MRTGKLKFDGIILQLVVLYILFHVDTNVMVNFCECSSNKVCLILRIGNFGRFVGSFFAIKKEIDNLRLQLIFAVAVIFDILTQNWFANELSDTIFVHVIGLHAK